MKNINIAVLFGGRAPEHEVSIITGIQVLNALKGAGYELTPIYVTKEGEWVLGNESFFNPRTFSDLNNISKSPRLILSCDPTYPILLGKVGERRRLKKPLKKRIDLVFPAFHGRYGEDGSVQGLLELSGLPYVGCDVQSSAIGMDKVISKKVAKSIGIPVLPDIWFGKKLWKKNKKELLRRISKEIGYPLYVKPVRLGSSIGITRVNKRQGLIGAIDVAFCYETKVMIEKGLAKAKEVNISIMGNDPYKLSATEEPVSSGSTLSFEDKYLATEGPSKGMASLERRVPAPIKKSTEKKIREYTKTFFREISGQGIARIDYLLSADEKRIYFNEINTMPGSVSFYLWKEVGVSFSQLVESLVKMALERLKEKEELITVFESNILEGYDKARGAKKF